MVYGTDLESLRPQGLVGPNPTSSAKKMIKQIYFDFGAVLVNYERVFQKVCCDFSLNFNNFLEFYSQFDINLSEGKIKTEEFWEKCIKKYNLKNAKDYDLPKSWVSDYDIIQPVNDLIYSLENKVDIGIISNICSGIWEAALKHKMVPNIKYRKVYLSYAVKMMKPNPDIYEKIQKESLVRADEILFIDDKEVNLIVPKSIGWKTVLFDMNKTEEGVKKIKTLLL